MIVTMDEARDWVKSDEIDDAETLRTLQRLITASEMYLRNATGKNFSSDNEQAKLFCLFLIGDWFDNRELIGKNPSSGIKFIIEALLLQLKYSNQEGSEADEIQS